jgi:hypothetical protein
MAAIMLLRGPICRGAEQARDLPGQQGERDGSPAGYEDSFHIHQNVRFFTNNEELSEKQREAVERNRRLLSVDEQLIDAADEIEGPANDSA